MPGRFDAAANVPRPRVGLVAPLSPQVGGHRHVRGLAARARGRARLPLRRVRPRARPGRRGRRAAARRVAPAAGAAPAPVPPLGAGGAGGRPLLRLVVADRAHARPRSSSASSAAQRKTDDRAHPRERRADGRPPRARAARSPGSAAERVTISPWSAAALARIGDRGALHLQPGAARARRRRGSGAGTGRCGSSSSGRTATRKGCPELVEALARARARRRRRELTFVGKERRRGEERRLRRLAESHGLADRIALGRRRRRATRRGVLPRGARRVPALARRGRADDAARGDGVRPARRSRPGSAAMPDLVDDGERHPRRRPATSARSREAIAGARGRPGAARAHGRGGAAAGARRRGSGARSRPRGARRTRPCSRRDAACAILVATDQWHPDALGGSARLAADSARALAGSATRSRCSRPRRGALPENERSPDSVARVLRRRAPATFRSAAAPGRDPAPTPLRTGDRRRRACGRHPGVAARARLPRVRAGRGALRGAPPGSCVPALAALRAPRGRPRRGGSSWRASSRATLLASRHPDGGRANGRRPAGRGHRASSPLPGRTRPARANGARPLVFAARRLEPRMGHGVLLDALARAPRGATSPSPGREASTRPLRELARGRSASTTASASSASSRTGLRGLVPRRRSRGARRASRSRASGSRPRRRSPAERPSSGRRSVRRPRSSRRSTGGSWPHGADAGEPGRGDRRGARARRRRPARRGARATRSSASRPDAPAPAWERAPRGGRGVAPELARRTRRSSAAPAGSRSATAAATSSRSPPLLVLARLLEPGGLRRRSRSRGASSRPSCSSSRAGSARRSSTARELDEGRRASALPRLPRSTSAVLYAAAFAVAPLAADVFRTPELTDVLRVMALVIPLRALSDPARHGCSSGASTSAAARPRS